MTEDRIARAREALMDFVSANFEDAQRLSALQFISNRDYLIVEGITAALASLPDDVSEDPWQPIETAPKDGTEIVLYGLYPENGQNLPTQRVTAGFWCVPEPRVVGDCGGECRCPEYADSEDPFWCTIHGGSDSGWMSTDGGFTTEWPPTHWMPLPAPPAAAIRGGAE